MIENKLSKAETNTDLWQKLNRIMMGRLETLRLTNDSEMTESETAKLRGRIAELKFLLDLPLADPVTTTDPGY